jgi:hypothetical protein
VANERVTDDVRYANAQAASHGFGAGQVEANRLIDGWDEDRAHALAPRILEHLERAQAYAERATPPFDDYVAGVRADEELARTLTPQRLHTLETVFVTGFDIGFRATLVERCAQLRERPAPEASTEQISVGSRAPLS